MKNIFIIFSILILFSNDVHSFGVVSNYLEDDTLILTEGASAIYSIRVQNPSGQPINFKMTFDKAYMDVLDYQEEYTVQPYSNYEIYFNISTENTHVENIYILSYTVHPLTSSGTGLPILINIAKSFKLKVIKDPEKFYFSDLYEYYPQFLIILIILFLIWWKKSGQYRYHSRHKVFTKKNVSRKKPHLKRKIIKQKKH